MATIQQKCISPAQIAQMPPEQKAAMEIIQKQNLTPEKIAKLPIE